MPIFLHELRHWLRQPLPYLYWLVLFAIAFVTMWGTASEATGGDNAEVINSGYRLVFMSNYLNNLLLFLLPTIVGVALSRDFTSRMYTVLFSYPITKRGYLLAKFSAALLLAVGIVGAIGLGFALGSVMPGIAPENIKSFRTIDYLLLYGLILLPNLFLYGALVFRIVIGTRNVYLAFIAIILVIIAQALLGSLLGGLQQETLAALLDPSGLTPIRSGMKYWTVAERNVQAIPLSLGLGANRLLWLTVSAGLCWSAWRSFSFSQFGGEQKRKETPGRPPLQEPRSGHAVATAVFALRRALPPVTYHYSPLHSLRTTWSLSNTDFRYIALSWPFAALLAGGFALVFFQQSQMNPQFGFEIQPTTAAMLQVPMFIFSFVINLVTFLYVGILAYRGQMTRMGDLVDTVPQPDWVLLLSRLLAILKVQLLLLGVVLVAGMLTQISKGYTDFEIGHYLFELLGLHFVHFLIWACMATFVHTLFRNLYLGFFLLLLLPFSFGAVAEVGKLLEWPFLQSGVLQFNAVPGTEIGFPYSDFFGYAPGLLYFAVYKTYWFLGGLLLLGGSLLLWKRGYTFSWRERVREIGRGRRMQSKVLGKVPLRVALLTAAVAFTGLGAGLFYHDHLGSHRRLSDGAYDAFLARNEQAYGRYLHLPQPRLVKARVDVDLYPEDYAFRAHGRLWYVNLQDRALDTILLATSLKEAGTYTVLNQHTVLAADTALHYRLLRLRTPLQPGDSLALEVDIRNAPNGWLATNDRVKKNGTYLLGYHILPSLGVRTAFLTSAAKRAKFGLGERAVPELLPTDTTLLDYRLASNPGARIDFATTVSTSADQVAFAMGNLVREWTEGDRRYFRYQSDGPIIENIGWLSGAYSSELDTAGVMPLEFHYLSGHGKNIGHIRRGVRASIDYCSAAFGALAHQSLKLVEFPGSYGSHATLLGNLIPYSERLLLCDVDHENNEVFNVPFFTGAHEVAHYWWGHRVDPANVAGGRFITEGLADYLAIRITEQEYGPDFSRGVLKFYHELYLRQRARSADEVPLQLAGLEQEYLNYRKAAIAFHALSRYLGEDRFNAALAAFEQRYRFAPPPLATSLDLVAALRAATPDSLRYLLTDYFETVTLYDNTLERVTIDTIASGGYAVTVALTASKFRADAKGTRAYTDPAGRMLTDGTRQSLPLADYLRLGFYAGTAELAVEQVRVDAIRNTFTFRLAQRPDRVVLDPEYLLVTVNREGGVWRE